MTISCALTENFSSTTPAIPSLRGISRLGCLHFFTTIEKLRLHGSVQSAKVSSPLEIYFADEFVLVTRLAPSR
jgi:hypothetical protein